MSLSFSNSTAQPIWVVIAYSDSDCTADGGSGWMKEGWWQIAPGTSATAHGGLSNGAKYFYFAEDNSGRVWSGEFGTSVPHEAFTQCWSLGNTDSQAVSMRKLEVPATSFSYTVNLTD